ncbi:MAG TPA: hypothetical protein VGO68_17710 [Pyrinomonadaceae bacterium]|jgi:hypothetical protein|nr:hypothetical protein [Pyrinomonadaceae bacterium]
MKRAFVLMALVALVVWLADAAPTGVKSAPADLAAQPEMVAPSALAPQEQCCLNPNETDPHSECFNNTCLQVNGCGTNVNCATCGCDPIDESSCLLNGGTWDSFFCSCSYGCDPGGYGQAECWSSGGTWNSNSCTCTPHQCNPGPREYWNSVSWPDLPYCDGMNMLECETTFTTYVRYCQDGSVYGFSSESVSTCLVGEPCGGGGGDPGECWPSYRPDSKNANEPGLNNVGDCWCDQDWGYCCDWDWNCWEIEETAN